MTRAELEALAERVEREEPSLDLAVEVMRACGRKVLRSGSWRSGWSVLQDNATSVQMPDPLHSLDAAVTLVPEWARWFVETGDRCSAVVSNATALFPADRWQTDGNAAAPAAALTAAALRARGMEAGDA